VIARSIEEIYAVYRASAGLTLDQASVSGSPVVTHHFGALIALGTLLAINLAWISNFFFGWW